MINYHDKPQARYFHQLKRNVAQPLVKVYPYIRRSFVCLLVAAVIAGLAVFCGTLAFAQSGSWTTKASMPTARGSLGVGVVGGKLYAVGGFNNGSGALTTVEAYDPVTVTWSTVAPMATPRNGTAVGVVNGLLYAVGGDTDTGATGYLASIEAYDPVSNTWSPRAPMPTPRDSLGVGVVNGKLYALGGQFPNRVFHSTVEAYDPVTNTWSTRAPMPMARFGFGVGVVNNILYVVGGHDGSAYSSTVDAYDPVTDTWSTKAPLPTIRAYPAVTVVNGFLYAIGGEGGGCSGPCSVVEAYNPATDTWTTVSSMPTARGLLAGGAVDGRFYAVGGRDSVNYLSTVEAFTSESTPTPTPTPFPITAKGNGKLTFTADPGNGTRQIFVSDADGANPAQLTHLGGNFTPAFSPDGTKIAFVSKRDGNGEIYVMNADGSNQVRLTNVPQADGGPTWSPDGTRIAFLSERNSMGNSQIYVMNADGTNQTRLTNSSASYSHPAWSPDGTRIAADSNSNGGRTHLYLMNSDGSNETQLLPNPETTLEEAQAAWSPNGTRLLFIGGDLAGGVSDIVSSKLYSMRADGSDPVQLTMSPAAALDISPTYSPNGLRIAFVRYSDAAASVGAVVTADSGGGSVSPPIHDSIEGHAVSWQPVNDTTPPTTNANLNGTVGSNGWYTSNVSVTLNAADNSGGTGVKRISYSGSGAQAIAPTTAGGASVNFTIDAEGETTLTYFVTDNADNVQAAQTLTVKIDKTMPAIDCASPDGSWHAADVTLACSSNDGDSGLSNAADANFTLSTSVAAGTEDANAPTGSRTVCDRAGNCAAAGPVGGNKVDKKAPDITITVPASGVTYALGQVVAAAYNCNDGTGAGIATCAGPVANGANLDTSAGSHVFTVTSTDNVGNANSTSVTYSVKGAAEQVADLMALIDSFNLKKKVDKKFDHKLDEVLKALNKNKTDEACKKLADLFKDAQHESGKKLTAAEANQIIDAANQIRAVLGCVR